MAITKENTNKNTNRRNRENDNLDHRDFTELDEAFILVDSIVNKTHLSSLEKLPILQTTVEFDEKSVFEQASLFKVQKIVYDIEENNLQKLVNTYASSVAYDGSIVMLINSTGYKVEIFLGTTGGKEVSSSRARTKALLNNFCGNFPGSLGNYDDVVLDNTEITTLIEKITSVDNKSISSVSGVGSSREENDIDNKKYIQGIEKLIDTMQGTSYSAIFIANIVNKDRLVDIKAEYEMIYTQLSPFAKSELSFNESSADGISQTVTNTLSKTISTNKSSALSVGESESKAHTDGGSKTHTDTVGGSVSSTNGVSANAGVNAGVVSASAGVHSSLTVSGNYSHSYARTKNWSDTLTKGTTKNQTETVGESEAKSEIKSNSDGTTSTKTTGRTVQVTNENKTVKQLLDKIDEQLRRIEESENYGVFGVAAYFLAPTTIISNMAASSYKSIINGKSTYVENSRINSWQDTERVDAIKKYLKKLHHPVFVLDEKNTTTPASIVSGKELAVQFSMPKKSINGVTVMETASFGRNIDYSTYTSNKTVDLGNLYHMGRDEESVNGKIHVKLDLNSLAMHTFITGSTGSGKSNAIYSIIEEVLEHENVRFMVIEPAKGEYKDKFGYRNDVRVLGTNIKKTELLKINPFSFPEDIHVLEHIDRLIDIFNVCWPMYAAMPAILKDSIERAYINAGWDLSVSECRYVNNGGEKLYPCFKDVLNQINIVMEESEYSKDSKGDYIGALSTRIKSLTNGLYSQIFTPAEISGSNLFDENVIVDLSRVGSIETKSLIMGLLILKMQEYRMANSTANNSKLKHITVLEEAHNLLKRTTSEQSSDSSNLLGKSVEMLSNAIAEMRTYGEGFIIADQAPGMLDMSAIRNTNTKIILRLPDLSDRELVGRAAALNDNQIVELAKLKTGVAAVYQNNWLEPILCSIKRSDTKEKPYKNDELNNSNNKDIEKILDYIMLPINSKNKVESKILKELEEIIYKSQFDVDTKINFLKYTKEEKTENIHKLKSKIIYNIFNPTTAFALSATERHDISSWYEMMISKLEPSVELYDKTERDKILAMLTMEQLSRNENTENASLFSDLMKFVKKS